MKKVIAMNGSPRMEKDITGLVLASFVEGMMDSGSSVGVFHASWLKRFC